LAQLDVELKLELEVKDVVAFARVVGTVVHAVHVGVLVAL
jgi:hypothetical protein